MTVKIEKDKVADVLKTIRGLTSKQVLVGIAGDSPKNDRTPLPGEPGEPITNAELGYIHEFGAPEANIPARPFLIPGVDKIRDEIIRRMKQAGKAALDGDNARVDALLNALGLTAVAAVKQKMVDGPFVPLSPVTIAARERRGVTRTNPLIDTAALNGSIDYVIAKKKG